ncbi:hypothetical protein SSX86_029141 [Deinandra increscens subsp. villosa]|uniref:Hflx-type G domain-containing protein n=1 Tax=Deinandra increscens subsp. villosa TaxID=3103831 RepID=A0AAP0GL51_9ASTR
MFRVVHRTRRGSIRSTPQLALAHTPPLFSDSFANSQSRYKHEEADADEFINKHPDAPPRLFVVQPRFRPDSLLKIKLDEALNLANSLEEQRDEFYESQFPEKESLPHLVVQNPAYRSTRADTFFGPGTVDTIKCHLNAESSQGGVDAVFVNGILTGIQQRNLERKWGKAVLDRVGLIIEIFHAHAQTKEAKLQAELAALMYKRTRLVRIRGSGGRLTFGASGEAEIVSAKGRGSGGRGFISGAGETELQLQRRRIIERKNQLLLEIKDVRRTRALQRASRKRHGGTHGQHMPTVAIVGYTNAGKSTLVGALSDTHLFCDNRMFATVDTKVRHVILPSGKKVLLSDTVGFISDLPVQLVEAFHATLEEVVEADLLVHVLDSSAPDRDEQRESVLQVLEQIGVSTEKLQNMIEVWNKVVKRPLYPSTPVILHDHITHYFVLFVFFRSILKMNKKAVNEESTDKLDEDLDGWLCRGGDEVNWDDATASFVGWKAFEDQPKDVSTLSGQTRRDIKPRHEFSPHVKTSGVTRVGLQELLGLIDDKLKTDKVVERSVFDRKWRPPQQHDTGVVVG